jgi:cellulose synthase operon protein C
MTLTFPDVETLHFAVSGGILPPDILAAPIVTWQDSNDHSVVRMQVSLSDENLQLLSRLGVEVTDDETSENIVTLSHWLQFFPVIRDAAIPGVGLQTPVLFELADAACLGSFVNELLRQGHDRSAVRQFAINGRDRTFVRVIGPPYYTLLSALDGEADSATAFLEAAPRVCVQLGYSHPYAAQIDVPEGQLLLMRVGRNWEPLADGPYRDVGEILDVIAPPSVVATDTPWPEPIIVPLTPSPSASTEQATLWVVRQDAVVQMDGFVQRADAKIRNQLAFAVTDSDGEQMVVLRLRPSKLPPPTVPLVAEAYRPWLRLPNLFVPVGTRIDPPLRRDTMQKMLAADAGIITWLVPSANDFKSESLPDGSFQPLSAWIDVVLDREREPLNEWVHATEFGFAGLSVEESVAMPPASENRSKSVRQPSKSEEKKQMPTPRETRPLRRPAPIRDVQRIELPGDMSELREQLTEVEAEFLAVDGPLDDARRQAMWPRIAKLNAALRQPAEAALAWAHAVWDQANPTVEQSRHWVRAENALGHAELSPTDVDRLLAPSPATASDVRAVAAVVVWSARQTLSSPLLARLADVQTFLQANERLLPARATWLAWCAWAKLAGGDTLALARARDRLLARLLERGLDADADLPAFLRFAGRLDADRLRNVREWIDDVRTRIRNWFGEQSKADLNRDATAAYIDLFFAFGLARLGEASAARALLKRSEAILEDVGDDTRDAHLVLLQALSWRVEEVLAGRTHSGPLPKELLDYLAQMHVEAAPLPRTNEYDKRRTGPYAVERFREQSRIMEPLEKFDPYRHTRREGHDLVREAARLPDVRDASSLAIRINQLLRPTEGVPELRLRVLAECVSMTGRLGADVAGGLLDRVAQTLAVANPTTDGPALEIRLRLIERSLFFAAHFDRSDLVTVFVDHLVRLFETDAATAVLEGAGYAMGQTLRSLRKLGLRDETMRILERLEAALTRGQSIESLAARPPRSWPALLQTLLHVAAGWIYFDNHARAAPVLDAARRLLVRTGRPAADEIPRAQYVQVLCNLIAAFGLLPPQEARGRIADLFAEENLDRLPNTYTTASFYSRFHLNVAEAVVLTLSGEDFTLGPAARRWLDEDEYLIRRRVHRDVRAALERG